MATDKEGLKAAARGRWREILEASNIPRDLLDGKHHRCPKCGGKDRWRFTDSEETGGGGAICNQCGRWGDGLAVLQWWRGCDFPAALRFVAEFLGLGGDQRPSSNDPLERVASEKRVTAAALKAYGAKAVRGAVVLPAFGPDRRQCSTFTIRPGDKGKFAGGKPAGVFLPVDRWEDGCAIARSPAAGEVWLAVEGVKDAAALWALGFLAVGLNTNRLSSKFIPLLRGVHVIFIPDRDTAGDQGFQQAAAKIFRTAASVMVAALPLEMKAKGGGDVRDLLALQDGEKKLREAIDTAAAWNPPADNHRLPEIRCGVDEDRMTLEASAALAAAGGCYQRGGSLVEIRESPPPPPCIVRPDGGVRAVRMARPRLRERIAGSSRFLREKITRDGTELILTPVPQSIVEQVETRGSWPTMPVLEGVVSSPQFLRDGSVLFTPGYDARSGIYLEGGADFRPIPDRPTREDAIAARDELLEVVVDFPFREVERSAWLGLVLTVPGRHAIDGPAPLFGIDANTRGSGKTLAADSVGVIHTGRALPRSSLSPDGEEARKTLTAVFLAGEPLTLFDNLNHSVGGAALDAALTSTTWTDRVLGQSQMTVALPNRCVFIVTGNNLTFAADTARRTLRMRLESPLENPEERTGFKHPNLLRWVKEERGRLASASVLILRAWHCAGRPDMGLPLWGSFEAWSELIRNALVWVGLPDPGEMREEVKADSDSEAMLLRQLLGAWEEADPMRHGLSVADAIERSERSVAMREVVAELGSGKKNPSRTIGMKLHHLKGRVSNSLYFHRLERNHSSVWVVKSTESDGFETGTKGTTGTSSSPYAGESSSTLF